MKPTIMQVAEEVLRSVLGPSIPFKIDAQDVETLQGSRIGQELRLTVFVNDGHRGLLIGNAGATARSLSTVLRAALTFRGIREPVNLLVSSAPPRG